MNIFDIIGPIMVGPSSSHTAGAVRIGYIVQKLLQDKPVDGIITLHGSFADTGLGHGTDKALVAGILGMKPDDARIPDSFLIAEQNNFRFVIKKQNIKDAHPNTAVISLTSQNGKNIEVQASSIGGGRIVVNKLDGIDVNFSGEKPTLIVHNLDKPGHVAKVTSMLAYESVNIATMQLYRKKRGEYAVMVIESDQYIPKIAISHLDSLEGILKVTYFEGMNA